MKPSDLMRYVSCSSDPDTLSVQVGENARDGNAALSARVKGYTKTVSGYSATGSTSTLIALVSSDKPPTAITLARAFATRDPSAAVAAVGIPNFYYVNGLASVYEPSGLTANTLYELTFLVLE